MVVGEPISIRQVNQEVAGPFIRGRGLLRHEALDLPPVPVGIFS